MYDVLDVAAYVINKYCNQGKTITNLKLQKILYYIQGYCLKQNSVPAFSESLCKWPYGPVAPQVYFAYSVNRSNPIPALSDDQVIKLSKIFKKDHAIKKVIDDVISRSFDLTAVQMVEMTHNETPWMQADDSDIISIRTISSYFDSNDPLELEED